jgi:hypothetical protein
MDLAVPYVFMFYVAQFAQGIKFEGHYLLAEFSLEHFKLLKKSQLKLLKTIDSEFYKETNLKGDNILTQFYIDDNFFNGFFSVFTTIE